MKGAVVAASLAVVLSAAPVFAQAAGQAPARPAAPSPAPPPAAQAAPAPAPQAPPPPFPAGAKVAFVNLQQIANLSGDGKISTAKVQALMQKKQTEAAAKTKALADAQTKLQQSGALMSDAARTQLEKDIERMNVEGQRFQQDAQAEINELSQALQNEFQQKLFPVLDLVSKEKGIQILLSAADAGVVWADPALDLTLEAVRKLDTMPAAAPKAAAPAAPKAATPPAAPAAPAPAAPKQ